MMEKGSYDIVEHDVINGNMKIAIITPYDSSNFGAFLQAYCLKYVLEKEGHIVYHVKHRDVPDTQKLFYNKKPVGKKEILFPILYIQKRKFGKEKYRLFAKDQEYFVTKPLTEIDADLFILGSDEIWNINRAIFQKGLYWGDGMSPLIAYAPSIGGADIEKFKEFDHIVKLLNRIDIALVRDEKTREMVKKYSDIKTELVCDPTMLVPVKAYEKEFKDEYVSTHDCLLVYAYESIKKEEREAIIQTAKEMNLKTVSSCFFNTWCDYQVQCSPLQFSSLIQQCKAVITTTFHGTVFSILNHANFASITVSPKTKQLLAQLGLADRGIDRTQVNNSLLYNILCGQGISYDVIDETINSIRETSLSLLNDNIKNSYANKKNSNYCICSNDMCTGCFACKNKCPVQAISINEDQYGRTIPQIDNTKCINCGLCHKVCPALNEIEKKYPVSCYAAQMTNESEREYSSSGGIATLLAKRIIKDQGVCFGAIVDDNGNVVHSCATTENEANLFRTSKYVQSSMDEVYSVAKKHLNDNRQVLFVGTPCQDAALKSYLGREYNNLFCVDIICHGVPPMKYLKQHINSVANGAHISNYTFRGGKKDFELSVYSDDKLVYQKNKNEDAYYYSFLKSICYRENCYGCKYAMPYRCSDMTIGDFWGLNRDTLEAQLTGRISVVLINTEKGKELFDRISDDLTFEERSIEEALKGNPQLNRPSRKHSRRESFIQEYKKTGDFDKAVYNSGVNLEIQILRVKNRPLYRLARKILKHK